LNRWEATPYDITRVVRQNAAPTRHRPDETGPRIVIIWTGELNPLVNVLAQAQSEILEALRI
jgi:hypothetical protein